MARRRRYWLNAVCIDCGRLAHVELLPPCGTSALGNGEVLQSDIGWRKAAVMESARRRHDCEHRRQTLVHAYFLTWNEKRLVEQGRVLAVEEIAKHQLHDRLLAGEVQA